MCIAVGVLDIQTVHTVGQLADGGLESQVVRHGDQAHLVAAITDQGGWTIKNLIPIDYLDASAASSLHATIALCSVFTLIGVWAAFRISDSITLDSVRWLSIINKQNQIKEIVEALSKLIGHTFRNSGNMITFQKELELSASYISIK